MTYVVNTARVHQITIGGRDVTSNLVNWNASDASANRNGCVITTGSVTLATNPGNSLADYDRNDFIRGDVVQLTMTSPGGSTYTHPRGYLYVISSVYNPETEEIEIETGCTLAMWALNDESTYLQSIVPLRLDPAQLTFQNCCAAFSANSQYVWQTNTGAIEVNSFWGNSTALFTSILGETTTTAAPLAGGEAIPQRIKLSYQVPSSADDNASDDQKGKIEQTETTSFYFLNYPAVTYARIPSDATGGKPNGNLDEIGSGGAQNGGTRGGGSSSCGNTPPPPDDLGDGDGVGSCTDGYELKRTPQFVGAIQAQNSTSTYNGPGGQLSGSVQNVYGPLLEANQQYFADKFTFCRSTWASACNPNGSCQFFGLDRAHLGQTITYNYYGSGNQVIRQITDTYQNMLAGAITTDWRSGIVNGAPADFDYSFDSSYNRLYRVSRVETFYEQSENSNLQTTITYTSVTSRGTGIKSVPGGIDALSGIQTKQIRRSTTISTLDISPDIVNSPTTQTEERSTILLLGTSSYVTGFSGYEVDAQLPVPVFVSGGLEVENSLIANYSTYLKQFIKGDAFGLQLGESMIDAIQGYRPGVAFRYVDNSKSEIMAMHMDATVWGASLEESAFVTNGLWAGFSDGTPTSPNNLYGNATPVFDLPTSGGNGNSGGATLVILTETEPTTRPNGSPLQPGDVWQTSTALYSWDGTNWVLSSGTPVGPPPPSVDPGIDNETGLDAGPIAEVIEVQLMFSAIPNTSKVNGIQFPPSDSETDIRTWRTMTSWVSGMIVGPGDLLSTDSTGSIPIEYNGVLVIQGATVINQDLFGS